MREALQKKTISLLRWSEKYTKTDMLYLAKGGFWLTTSQVIGTLTSLATSVAFANWLPQETYGIYRYVLSVMPILIIPTLTGMDTAITRAVAQGKEHAIHAALALKMHWGLLGTLSSIGLASYYYLQGDSRLAALFLIAAAFIPLMEPFNLFVALLTGRRDFRARTYYGAFTRILPTVTLVTIVFLTKNIFVIVGGYFASYTLARFIAFRLTTKYTSKNAGSDLDVLGFGKHLSAMNILGTISTSLDSILIFHFGGAAMLAGYYLAMVPYSQASSALSNLNIMALPKLSLNTAKNLTRTLPRKVARLYLLVIPIVLIYAIIAPFFFSILYPKYVSYVILSIFFMLQILFYPTTFFYAALTALGETKKMYVLSVINAGLRILLLVVLTSIYGMWGAASAVLISGLVIAILKTYSFYRI